MEEEKWVYVDGFNSLYMVSDMGRIMSFNKIKGRIMSPSIAPNGYAGVTLIYPESTRNRFTVHSIVANHFVSGKTEERNEVNHINGDKLDNKASNLEWCTREENMTHHRLTNNYGKDFHIRMENEINDAWERLGKNYYSSKEASDRMKTSFNPRSNPVIHLETGIFYNSLSEAYRSYNIAVVYQTVYTRALKGKSVFMYV